jgi:hypothetical protein
MILCGNINRLHNCIQLADLLAIIALKKYIMFKYYYFKTRQLFYCV